MDTRTTTKSTTKIAVTLGVVGIVIAAAAFAGVQTFRRNIAQRNILTKRITPGYTPGYAPGYTPGYTSPTTVYPSTPTSNGTNIPIIGDRAR